MRLCNKAPRYLVLGIILLTGLWLRTDGLKWGIPKAPYGRSYHPDETVAFANILNMGAPGQKLNPHYFINPTFHYYLIGSVWWLAGSLRLVPSLQEIVADSPTVTLDAVTRIWLLARSISVALGVLTIWLTYLAGREFFKNGVAALTAAWLAAVMPTLVVQSHYMAVDGPVGFWFLAALLLLLRAFRGDRLWLWAAAGLAAGISTATKYNAIVGIISVFIVLCFRQIKGSDERFGSLPINAPVFAGGLLAGFLIGCPHAVLSFSEWKEGLRGLIYYNDFATDWLYPWLHTSRFSLGWPGWILFLVSLLAIFIKPDRRGMILAAAIFPYFLIYGYKASPYMRHLVLVVPLMLLLVVYAAEKALRSIGRRSLKAMVAVMLILASGYALANSLAWLKIMSGQDTREEAADYVRQSAPPGSDVGLAGRSWFYTPPLDEGVYNLIRLEYQPDKLEYFHPPLLIMSEYESQQYAFCQVTPAVRSGFFRLLKDIYRVKRTFKRVPRCCGLSFEGYPLADWNYFYPTITVYERSF